MEKFDGIDYLRLFMSSILLSSAYLPPVQYFAHMLRAERVYVEQFDHYQKQTYRNRCVIAAPDGPLALTLPIEKPETAKAFMRDIRISDHGNWRHLHWNALQSAYNHTPFFEYYKDDFIPFFEKKHAFLVDFNENLIQLICSLIDMQPQLDRTMNYHPQAEAGVDDLREVIHPKRDYTLADEAFKVIPYYQVFQERLGFLPNLSIVDLLFNMGPESLLILQESIQMNKNP